MSDENRTLVERIFGEAPFTRSLGIELSSVGNGWCEARVSASPSLQQQHGFLHGGALMTLLDHACGGVAASTVPEDCDVITVENTVSFLRPASGSDLVCRAEVLRAGKTLVFVEAEVMVNGKDGAVLVAKALSRLPSFRLSAAQPQRPAQSARLPA